MSYDADFLKSMPYFMVNNNMVQEIGDSFLKLVGFEKSEIEKKDIGTVLKSILRINTDINEIGRYATDYFIFTKNLEPREVEIEIINLPEGKIYKFDEKPDSRFEDKNIYIEQISKAEICGIAVYTVPDMILVKANQKYLSFLEEPFNQKSNSIGYRIEEIISG